MGLDTYASRTPDDTSLTEDDNAAFQASGIDLCGGIWSDGATSIRGKIYDALVMEVSGVSLYQEWMEPDDVRAVSAALDAHSPEELARMWDELDWQAPEGGHAPAETAGLQAFFRLCASRGLGLIGWW